MSSAPPVVGLSRTRCHLEIASFATT